jgi:hypothetical protein
MGQAANRSAFNGGNGKTDRATFACQSQKLLLLCPVDGTDMAREERQTKEEY